MLQHTTNGCKSNRDHVFEKKQKNKTKTQKWNAQTQPAALLLDQSQDERRI